MGYIKQKEKTIAQNTNANNSQSAHGAGGAILTAIIGAIKNKAMA